MHDEDLSILSSILKRVAPEKGVEFTDLDILAAVNNLMYISQPYFFTLVPLHPILHRLL